MNQAQNKRFNFQGNFTDEVDGSYYVRDENGRTWAGPFGSGSYAITVRKRLNASHRRSYSVDYEPP